MKLQALLEHGRRRELLTLQQRLIDDIKGGEIDVKLAPNEAGLLITTSHPGVHSGFRIKLKIVLDEGWSLFMWRTGAHSDWEPVSGSSDYIDFDDIVAEVQSYTFGPQG